MANTNINKPFASSGNVKKWTWSFWFKRSKLGTDQTISTTYLSSSYEDRFAFNGNDQIDWYSFQGGSYSNGGRLNTNRVFRDTNAWYHVVLRWDTGNSTANDRMKIWINGVEETSFANRTNPATNRESLFNYGDNSQQWIIGSTNDVHYYDGSISHMHFCDGQSYQASNFGSTDSTTGEWKINTSPSITMGTNGFTILKDGITITDQSSNSNDWSLRGGTLTKTEDNPSNVFATWNPLNRGNAQFTYTNGNNTITVGGNTWTSTMGTLGFSSGKFYWEITDLESECQMGVCDAGINIASSTAQNLTGVTTFYNQSGGEMRKDGSETTANYGLFNSTDVIGIAVDMDNKLISIYKNGSAHVTNYALSPSMTTAMPFHSGYYANNLIKTNFGNGYFGTTAVSSAGTNASNNGIFEYDVPTGYTALSTKGLNL